MKRSEGQTAGLGPCFLLPIGNPFGNSGFVNSPPPSAGGRHHVPCGETEVSRQILPSRRPRGRSPPTDQRPPWPGRRPGPPLRSAGLPQVQGRFCFFCVFFCFFCFFCVFGLFWILFGFFFGFFIFKTMCASTPRGSKGRRQGPLLDQGARSGPSACSWYLRACRLSSLARSGRPKCCLAFYMVFTVQSKAFRLRRLAQNGEARSGRHVFPRLAKKKSGILGRFKQQGPKTAWAGVSE